MGPPRNHDATLVRMREDTVMNLAKVPSFAGPDTFHVVVESPRGSRVKWKYEPAWDAMTISRPLPLGLVFPFDWGFVPSTEGPDGDPIDALVWWDASGIPSAIIPCRAVGVMRIEQNRTNHDASVRIRNDRVLAVPVADRRAHEVTTLDALPSRVREECEHFAVAATALEGKNVHVLGWGDAAAALALVRESQARSTSGS